MKYRFITIVHNLSLEKQESSVVLKQGVISNKAYLRDVTLRNQLSFDTLGLHSIDEFDNMTYYYIDGKFDNGTSMNVINSIGTKMTFMFLRVAQFFTNDLWLLRDNSIYLRDGFLFTYDKDISDGCTFKGALSAINSRADRGIKEEMYTNEELLSISEGMTTMDYHDLTAPDALDLKHATQDHMFKASHSSREERARFFVQYARSSGQTPIKLLFYNMALETLLSTVAVELSHRVSERAALIMGNDAKSKKSYYDLVKKSYDNRSKVVHGDVLKDDGKFEERSVGMDNLLRAMLNNTELLSIKDSDLDDYFTGKLFGEE